MSDWMTAAANEITSMHVQVGELHERVEVATDVRRIIERWSPVDRILCEAEETEQTLTGLQAELGELRAKEPPLLQCVDCKNTESPAGAMARQFNHGRCLHCGGYFKVVRA
jgi:hypothetical protein